MFPADIMEMELRGNIAIRMPARELACRDAFNIAVLWNIALQ